MKDVVWENYPEIKIGGQSCGIPIRGFTLSHPDFNFKVSCCDFRSQMENRQICIDLFELFLMQVK